MVNGCHGLTICKPFMTRWGMEGTVLTVEKKSSRVDLPAESPGLESRIGASVSHPMSGWGVLLDAALPFADELPFDFGPS